MIRRTLFATLAAAALAAATCAETFVSGVVVRVYDGDTILIETRDGAREKVRLQGIDAPERGQAHWRDSYDFLRRAIGKKNIVVRATGRDSTPAKRVLGFVESGGENLNLLMVCRGQAWYFREYAHELSERERTQFDACETRARSERIGLWQQLNPIPPRTWRHRFERQQ